MFKIMCIKCNKEADILSCRKVKNKKLVEIKLICPQCGKAKIMSQFLYGINESEGV